MNEQSDEYEFGSPSWFDVWRRILLDRKIKVAEAIAAADALSGERYVCRRLAQIKIEQEQRSLLAVENILKDAEKENPLAAVRAKWNEQDHRLNAKIDGRAQSALDEHAARDFFSYEGGEVY